MNALWDLQSIATSGVHPMLLGIDWMDPNWLLDRFGTALFWISMVIVFVECGLFFPILPGDTLLFALGLFKDVRLEVNGDVLVVVVEERPTVADVDFVGTREFDKDTLKKALREIGLTEGRPYDQALADRAEQELKRQYINRSLYGAEVVTTVTPLGHCARTSRNTDWSTISAPPLSRKEYTISVWNRLALFLSMCFGVEDGPLR